jgi:hypothetical protein
MIHVIPDFYYFSDNLVTWIRETMTGYGRGCNVEVSINENEMQVASANACERVTYAHPVGCR